MNLYTKYFVGFCVSILLALSYDFVQAGLPMISNRLVSTVCNQRLEFFNSRMIQSPQKTVPDSLKQSPCGWFGLEKCKGDTTCASLSSKRYKTCEEIGKLGTLSSRVKSGNRKQFNPRVYGGRPIKPNQHPSNLNLWIDEYGHICGAVIINENWGITANHCKNDENPDDWKKIYVVAGDHNTSAEAVEDSEQTTKIVKWISHPEEEQGNEGEKPPKWDIALIKFDPPFKFNENVKPAALPSKDLVATGEALLVGWGQTGLEDDDHVTPDIASEIELPIITDDQCTKFIAESQAQEPDTATNYTIREFHLCAGGEKGKSACNGDSGGPLYRLPLTDPPEVIGIVCAGTGECGDENVFTIFSEVSFSREWIDEQISQNS